MVGDKGSRCVFNRDGIVLPDRTGGSIKGTDEIGGNHGFYRETSSCSRNRSERYCSDQAVGRQGSEAGCVRGQRKGRQRAGCIKDPGGKPPKPPKEENKTLQAIYQEISERLKQSLSTKVSVSAKQNGAGKIEIEFYNHEDLERLLERITG